MISNRKWNTVQLVVREKEDHLYLRKETNRIRVLNRKQSEIWKYKSERRVLIVIQINHLITSIDNMIMIVRLNPKYKEIFRNRLMIKYYRNTIIPISNSLLNNTNRLSIIKRNQISISLNNRIQLYLIKIISRSRSRSRMVNRNRIDLIIMNRWTIRHLNAIRLNRIEVIM